MIDITRDGTKLVVKLTGGYTITDRIFRIEWDTDTEWAAILLSEYFRKQMQEQLNGIRERSYDNGWKDAKAHRAKAKWFSYGWKDL